MMKTMKNILHTVSTLAVILSLAVSVGCATSGNSDQGALSDTIKPGMTREQVVQIAGKPQSKNTGMISLSGMSGPAFDEQWSYHDGALNLIPFVGIARGGRTNMTLVRFNKGKVVQVAESSTGMW